VRRRPAACTDSARARRPANRHARRRSARAKAAAATRERLLAAAWQHFATHPYEDVRLHEIATDAEVTAQTLHTHFGSKDQLLTAAYIWFGQQEITLRDTGPAGDIHRAIEILFDRYEAHGIAILRMLSQEDRIPAIAQMTEAGRAYHREWAAKTFTPLLRGLRGASHERRLAAIVVATDLLVWKLLRQDMQLDRTRAEAVVVEMMCYSS
jgi:AcrR family transcriptional regulator